MLKNIKNLSKGAKSTLNINKLSVHIEPPRQAGSESEFFLQSDTPNTSTCIAHLHNAVELIYVKTGNYRVLLDGEEYEIGAGDLILFCSNSIHYVFAKSDPFHQYYVIKIPPAFFLEFSQRELGSEYIMRFALNRSEKKVLWTRDELAQSEILPILNMLIKEYNEQKYAADIAIRLKTMELLLAILRESTQKAELPSTQTVELIYNIMIYVRSHYAENLDEKQLAKSVGMSYSYFSRSFKRVAGMTFKKYLNLTRVRNAEQFLCTGNESITEIGTKCGYNSTSYFINVYKSVTGKTPYQVHRQRTE